MARKAGQVAPWNPDAVRWSARNAYEPYGRLRNVHGPGGRRRNAYEPDDWPRMGSGPDECRPEARKTGQEEVKFKLFLV